MKRSLSLSAIAFLIACASPAPEVDPEHKAEIEAWRASRLERLTSEDGWLTVVGLNWLGPGNNRIGSNSHYEIPLEADGIPPFVGTLEIGDEGKVFLRTLADAGVTVNGEPTIQTILKSDVQGTPDVVGVGRFRFYIIDRDGKLAARVKDPDSTLRSEFPGIEHFPIDQAFQVTARLDPYDGLKEVQIPTVVGTPTTMLAPGLLHFTINGNDLVLEPYVSAPEDDSYLLLFRDSTSGHTTYGAGRFLSADAAGDDGKTVLDFNLAYNPPCAFTPFATCPLPTPQNSLAIAIEAGERFEATEH